MKVLNLWVLHAVLITTGVVTMPVIAQNYSLLEPLHSMNTIRVSLPYLPELSETIHRGILVDLVKAMDEVHQGQFIITEVFPFRRSVYNVLSGKADLHMPILFDANIDAERIDYIHSKATLFNVIFAIYTLKNRQPLVKPLSQYLIESDSAHVDLFEFDVIPSSSIEQSLKKLASGRIDAYIFAAKETDIIMEQLELDDVLGRQLYKRYPVKIAFRKTSEGMHLEQTVSSVIKQLEKEGILRKLFAPVDTYYDLWSEDVVWEN